VNKDVRNRIQRTTQSARTLLAAEFAEQLEGLYDIRPTGSTADQPTAHLDDHGRLVREKLLAAIGHHATGASSPADAIADYLREAAFTALNRFVALKLLEARGLIQECVSRGDQSSGFKEFVGLAPGTVQLEDHGYRLYIESLFDEIGQDVGVLFDRRDPAGILWPRRQALNDLLAILNDSPLLEVWNEDETIGWVYQYFNSAEERKTMRDESPAPRNSRELAVRNQFFTPRYVVQFLTDNTLGRLWLEMQGEKTDLAKRCEYLVQSADEPVQPRQKKDPRDLRILDPACGSGHFLLYSFDLLLAIYDEAWEDERFDLKSQATGQTLREDYPDRDALRRAAPALIIEHNLHGVEIDPRSAQIAALALWLRAQRAWKDVGIVARERPAIRRTHMVVAEPIPGDGALAEEFAARLDPPLLGELFKKVVDEMRLAGELGPLLRLEDGIAVELSRAREQFVDQRQATGFLPGLEPAPEERELDLSGIDEDAFFHDAEARIVYALGSFAEKATGGTSVQRRLFAGDATQGFAFVELLRSAFDVVLMNPPFGEMPLGVQAVVDRQYPEARNDIYAAFVRRAAELVAPCDGYVGAITSRAFVTGRDHRHFRRALLDDVAPVLTLFLDLGPGVLDSAMVETAAFVLGPRTNGDVLFVNARDAAKAADPSWLRQAPSYEWPRSRFLLLPQADLLYELQSVAFSELSSGGATFEPDIGRVTMGLTTKDDFRFVRLRWEISPRSIGRQKRWVPFSKGGEYSWFTADLHLVVNQHDGGSELAAIAETGDGNVAATRRSSASYFRAGICFSRRSQKGFSARRLRSHACFSDKSGVIIPGVSECAWLVALPFVLASQEYQQLISVQSKFGSYEIGPVKELPVPNATALEQNEHWLAVFRICDTLEQADELSERFLCPPRDERDVATSLVRLEEELVAGLRAGGLSPDPRVLSQPLVAEEVISNQAVPALSWLSWAVGAAFGRFDVRVVSDNRPIAAEPGFFDALPPCSPGMLTGDDGFPVVTPPPGYPLAFPNDGILVDDQGHPSDLLAAVRAAIDGAFGEDADAWWEETAAVLAPKDHDLRGWLSRRFFDYHLKRHSKSRRKAPILWQLSTSSGRYSVWLYAHRLTHDTLFQVQNDFVAPKVTREQRELTNLVESAGDNPSIKERKAIALQEAFVEELRTMLDDVKQVAPLWNPSDNDGIVLTAAPLWRLMPQNKAWQRELRGRWKELCAGDHDWAHIAMHLWPERVVLKCATDRSLAIAHGLEDVFWMEEDEGKWSPRAVPTHPVEDLVGERSSPGVTAALQTASGAPGTTPADRRQTTAV
jgi:hypothetical protein